MGKWNANNKHAQMTRSGRGPSYHGSRDPPPADTDKYNATKRTKAEAYFVIFFFFLFLIGFCFFEP